MSKRELVVFVDQNGNPTGETGPKLKSHNAETRLHLGFSCYIFRKSDNKFLMTQRSVTKKVWPGVWSNSVCGHPMPGESIEDSILRRAKYELGLNKLEDVTCVLPKYTYETPPNNGVIEKEFCPVYVAYSSEQPKPNLDEVEAYRWVPWPEFVRILTEKSAFVSYWSKDQYKHLKKFEPFVSLLQA